MKSFLSLTALCLASAALILASCAPTRDVYNNQPTAMAQSIPLLYKADSSNPEQLAQIKTAQPVGSTSPIVIIPPPVPTPLCGTIDAANLTEYERLKKLLCAQPWQLVYTFGGRGQPLYFSPRDTVGVVGFTARQSYLADSTMETLITGATTKDTLAWQHFRWCLQPTGNRRSEALGSLAWEVRLEFIGEGNPIYRRDTYTVLI